MAHEGFKNKTEQPEKIDKSRRRFFFGGAAAVAAAVAIPKGIEAFGGEAAPQAPVPLDRAEGFQARVEACEQAFEQNRAVFENPAYQKQDIMNFIHDYLTPTNRESLQGTRYDQEDFLRANNSFTSVQVRKSSGKDMEVRFAHEPNTEVKNYQPSTANGFFVERNGQTFFITNEHVMPDTLPHTILGDTVDLAGARLEDMPFKNDNLEESINRSKVSLADTDMDMHGKLVHITGIQENAGLEKDNTDIVSGFIFKVQDHFFASPDNTTERLFPRGTQWGIESQYFETLASHAGKDANQEELKEQARVYAANRIAIMKNSWMLVIPARNTDENPGSTSSDVKGLSGSSVFSNQSCLDNKREAMGALWGAGTIRDDERKISYTVAFVHGKEHLQALLDALKDGDVIEEHDEEQEHEEPQAESLERGTHVLKIQETLNNWLRSKRIETIRVDGDYGRQTQRAVYTFQTRVFGSDTSMYTPGIVDERTWEALFPGEPFVDVLSLP